MSENTEVTDSMALYRTKAVKSDLLVITEKRQAVFEKCVDKSGGPDACWPWMRKLNEGGYGRFKVGNHYPIAHRVAHVISGGEIPAGMLVCHRCDNPACCNPTHFFLGTQAGNVLDRVKKNRSATGMRHGRLKYPQRTARGIRQGSHKLSDARVALIRAGGKSDTEFANDFDVYRSTIQKVRLRQSWKHIP